MSVNAINDENVADADVLTAVGHNERLFFIILYNVSIQYDAL